MEKDGELVERLTGDHAISRINFCHGATGVRISDVIRRIPSDIINMVDHESATNYVIAETLSGPTTTSDARVFRFMIMQITD